MESDNSVGLTVRDLRLEAGLTQVSLAETLGITQGAVSHIETGRMRLTRARAEVLAQLFATTPDDIYTGEVWAKPIEKTHG